MSLRLQLRNWRASPSERVIALCLAIVSCQESHVAVVCDDALNGCPQNGDMLRGLLVLGLSFDLTPDNTAAERRFGLPNRQFWHRKWLKTNKARNGRMMTEKKMVETPVAVHYLHVNLIHRNCIATAMTGSTLTSSPSPAYAGGIRTVTNAPAASRMAKRL